MPAQAGRELLISLNTGSGLVEIAGQTTGTLNINRTQIDITTKSDDGVRKLMATLGTFSVDIDYEGILDNNVLLIEAFDDAPAGLYAGSVVIGAIGTVTGDFFLGPFTITGQDGDNAIGFTNQLMSSGTVTFT